MSQIYPIRDVPASELKDIPLNYSGVTFTRGRDQQYTVWHGGNIWWFTNNQWEAMQAHQQAMRGRQGLPRRD